MWNQDGDDVRLSSAQARFAVEHDARVGMLTPIGQNEVFLYHDDAWATYRWLVDDSGRAIEAITFRKSPEGVSPASPAQPALPRPR